ncbi:hypothetical protein TPB0596_11950 [Tsukamurella pulmonis]|uniref:hypothetical protein n=1 Tax=Tsukamurella pulmonis TaxID=47312 RepID=UPI001EDDFB78|nr:hypothetical protein [Tsukamurella pulmonis]BDD81432.1 hypothetical protein TPB0596_11950 [Tsukamurella pulmonis]
MYLTFVKELPPKAPAWCADVAEALRERPGEWAYFPHIGFPSPGADEDARDTFVEHFTPAFGYFMTKRGDTWFVRFNPESGS